MCKISLSSFSPLLSSCAQQRISMTLGCLKGYFDVCSESLSFFIGQSEVSNLFKCIISEKDRPLELIFIVNRVFGGEGFESIQCGV